MDKNINILAQENERHAKLLIECIKGTIQVYEQDTGLRVISMEISSVSTATRCGEIDGKLITFTTSIK